MKFIIEPVMDGDPLIPEWAHYEVLKISRRKISRVAFFIHKKSAQKYAHFRNTQECTR